MMNKIIADYFGLGIELTILLPGSGLLRSGRPKFLGYHPQS
jgi:hypothetical protein